ncbi:uncharacterized protein LOC144665101 [Oculina patagonica]
MASHLKIVLVTFLLMFILTEECKPVQAKGGQLKQKVKLSEKSMAEMNTKMKDQEVKIQEQEAKIQEQEAKIKALEECSAPAAASLEDSEILSGDGGYLKALGKFLAPVVQSSSPWKRCWRASRDGWAAATFHTKCDGKGPTVSIVRVGKYIFGGYTSASWTSGCQWWYDSEAFLFSLVNKPGWQPLKLDQTGLYSNLKSYSIYSCSSYGPTFGAGFDISIADNASSNNNSQANLGFIYSPPTGYSAGSSFAQSFLAGSLTFQPDEVEVFFETT